MRCDDWQRADPRWDGGTRGGGSAGHLVPGWDGGGTRPQTPFARRAVAPSRLVEGRFTFMSRLHRPADGGASMERSDTAERLAAHLRMLKNRAGVSYATLAKRTGTSRSALHRYCSGEKVPIGFGPVHAMGAACGATHGELREAHRLWALADAGRCASTPGIEPSEAPPVTGSPLPWRWVLRGTAAAVALTAAFVALRGRQPRMPLRLRIPVPRR
ncbi:helix-turn-helix domain-containing protein [Streptomyces griseorubiginosus]|uniref:helix-turn-helix domain-containing protein n=1 Tax=Streptomyces griseorubiginosus TaxID=67304 RepID=UPI0036993735